jgi:hypothetical protein
MRPGTLDLKTAALADTLPDKSLAAAKQLVAAEPRLLTHSIEKLQQRVQGLTEILGLGPEDLQAVLRKEPSLLHKSIVTLGGGWQQQACWQQQLTGFFSGRGAQGLGCCFVRRFDGVGGRLNTAGWTTQQEAADIPIRGCFPASLHLA